MFEAGMDESINLNPAVDPGNRAQLVDCGYLRVHSSTFGTAGFRIKRLCVSWDTSPRYDRPLQGRFAQ